MGLLTDKYENKFLILILFLKYLLKGKLLIKYTKYFLKLNKSTPKKKILLQLKVAM